MRGLHIHSFKFRRRSKFHKRQRHKSFQRNIC